MLNGNSWHTLYMLMKPPSLYMDEVG